MAEEKKQQVNVEMGTSLVDFVDKLAAEDQGTRSSVIRKLIVKEKERREADTSPLPHSQPKPKNNHAAQSVAA